MPKPPNADLHPTELTPFIAPLADASLAVRAKAAGEIFVRGRTLAHSAVATWIKDQDLAKCFVLDDSRFPQATVGLAVTPARFEAIRTACGSPPLATVPPDQDAQEFELEFPDGVRLDILTSRDPDAGGAIARHLRKFGESVQQIELLTKNIEEATQLLRSRFSIVPVYPETRRGANNTRVNFFLVTAAESKKVLIELVEATSSTHALC